MTTVLHLIESLGHGGAEHQLALVVAHLNPQRFKSVVCHLHEPAFLSPAIVASGAQVECLGLPRGKRALPRAVSAVRDLIRRHRVDLVHTSLFEADLVGGAAAALERVPCISTLCNIAGETVRLQDNPRNSLLKLRVGSALWSWSLRYQHAHCVAISESVKASAERSFGLSGARISVIYRALDGAATRVADGEGLELRARLGLAEAYPLILNVGRLAPQKGQKYLVAALPRIRERHPRAALLIVGEGWMRDELRQQAESLGVGESVHLLGKREDVASLLRAADLFAFPSLFEGLGVSALQAGATGVPCVMSKIGALLEMFEHERSALFVEPASVDQLADAIVRLADEPELARRLGATASERIRARFTVDAMVRPLEKLYDRLNPPARVTAAG